MILNWFPGFKKSGTFWENTPLRPGPGEGGGSDPYRSAPLKIPLFLEVTPKLYYFLKAIKMAMMGLKHFKVKKFKETNGFDKGADGDTRRRIQRGIYEITLNKQLNTIAQNYSIHQIKPFF